MNKTYFLLLFSFIILFSVNIQSQNLLDQYEYVLIPNQFNFQNKPNEYNINKALQASLNKFHFKAFLEGENIPKSTNPCHILKLKIKKSGFLSTKMNLIFNDCYGNEIYTSIEGQSRIKEYRPSFYEALNKILKDSNIKDHRYTINRPNKINKPAIKNTLDKLTISKNQLTLVLREQEYIFVEKNKNSYNILLNNQMIGTADKKENSDSYIINTKSLVGFGYFDDFGNFNITRKNPVNNKLIKDTMERIK